MVVVFPPFMDLVMPRRIFRRMKLLESKQNEKASARKRQFTGTRRVDEMFSAIRTIHRWHVPKATALPSRTSDCWDIVLGVEQCHTILSMIHWLSLVGDLRTNLDENSSVRDSIAFFSCLPPRLLGEKTESEKISRETVPYLVAEVSAKLKQIFDEIIADDAGAAAISMAVKVNSSLTSLDLSADSIGDAGASSLSQALTTNSSLTSLDLRGNSIGEAGASSLSQALTGNSSLTSLDLSANSIGEAGASSLSKALTANSSLTSLYLGGNSIGNAGASSLSQALMKWFHT